MWRDELSDTALSVLPPLVVGTLAVRLIFVHPAFWVYLVGLAITGALFGTVRRLLARHRARKHSAP
jgi:hypothetical protein